MLQVHLESKTTEQKNPDPRIAVRVQLSRNEGTSLETARNGSSVFLNPNCRVRAQKKSNIPQATRRVLKLGHEVHKPESLLSLSQGKVKTLV